MYVQGMCIWGRSEKKSSSGTTTLYILLRSGALNGFGVGVKMQQQRELHTANKKTSRVPLPSHRGSAVDSRIHVYLK